MEEGYLFYAGIKQNINPFAPDGWIHLTSMNEDTELQTFGNFSKHLHAGETSSLAIAQNRNWLFLSDDKAARKQAKQMHLQLSGTLGCLVLLAKRNGYTLAQINEWLSMMIQEGYRSPLMDLTPLL